MGNAASSDVQGQTSTDEGIITVSTAAESRPKAQEDLLERLHHLPQVKQINATKGPEDQLWRELTSYSSDQLQVDPRLTLKLLNSYKDFVNSRIREVDKLASEVLEESARRRQALRTATQAFHSLAATQQQMEELSQRLKACASAIAAASLQTPTGSLKSAGKP